MKWLRSSRFAPWLRDIGLMVLLLAGIRLYQQRNIPRGAAPELAGIDLSGDPLSLEDYRGRPVLLHFWATWCGVCRMEQANIAALAHDLPVVTVATHSGGAQAIAAYLRD